MFEENDFFWKEEQERILKTWADKGQCFKTMHERAYKKYWCLNAWVNLSVIIMSTITGTANFAQSSFGNSTNYVILAIGGINLLTAITTTIGQYTGVAQKLESHRISSISWDKFSRKIQVELSKARIDRIPPKNFVNFCQETYDRLIEVSPIIPNDITRWFNTMIETGYFDEDSNYVNICCYDCFCFPCGCPALRCTNSFISNPKKRESLEEIKKIWREIELPDILGKIKPTEIAVEKAKLPF